MCATRKHMKTCGICSRPDRAAIEQDMRAGLSQRAVRAKYRVDPATQRRHRDLCLGVVPPQAQDVVTAPAEAQPGLSAAMLVEHVLYGVAEARKAVAEAEGSTAKANAIRALAVVVDQAAHALGLASRAWVELAEDQPPADPVKLRVWADERAKQLEEIARSEREMRERIEGAA